MSTLQIAYVEADLFDLVNDGTKLVTDEGLQTAVVISLFTDRRATPDELRQAGLEPTDARGWPGDSFPEVPGDEWGSKLWLLVRALRTDETLERAVTYALEALGWLSEDGVVTDVSASARWLGNTGYLALTIEIEKTDSTRWVREWNVSTGQLLSEAA